MVLTLAIVLAFPFGFTYTLRFLLNAVGGELLGAVTSEPWDGTFYVHPAVSQQ